MSLQVRALAVLIAVAGAKAWAQTPTSPNGVHSSSESDGDPQNAARDAALEAFDKLSREADALRQAGQMSLAIAKLEEALKIAPEESRALAINNLAVMRLNLGNKLLSQNLPEALKQYRLAVFLLDVGWPSRLVRSAGAQRNLQIARDNLANAHARVGTAYVKLAKELQAQGRLQEALVELSLARKATPNDPEAWVETAEVAAAVGGLAQSKAALEQAQKLKADSVGYRSWIAIGSAQAHAGDNVSAAESFNRALALEPAGQVALQGLEDIWKAEAATNPDSALAQANLGLIYQRRKQYDLANQHYKQAEALIAKDPNLKAAEQVSLRLNRGSLFLEQKNYRLAEQSYGSVLQLEPNNLQAKLGLAVTLRDKGDVDGAIKVYGQLFAADQQNKDYLVECLKLAKGEVSDGDAYSEASVQRLQAVAAMQPHNAEWIESIAELLHLHKSHAAAEKLYRDVLTLNDKSVEAMLNLSSLTAATGRRDEAREWAKKVLAVDPGNRTAQDLQKQFAASAGYDAFQKAEELKKSGHNDEAIALYKKAAEESPDEIVYRYAYGVALQKGKKLDEAIALYKDLAAELEAKPNEGLPAWQAHFSLGIAYQEKGDVDQAILSYEKVLKLNPSAPDAQKALDSAKQGKVNILLDQISADYEAKRFNEAIAKVNQIDKLQPRNGSAYYYKGLAQQGAKRPLAEVLPSFRKAVEYDPRNSQAWYALGVNLEGSKPMTPTLKQETLKAYRRFVELAGKTPSADDKQYLDYARARIRVLSGAR